MAGILYIVPTPVGNLDDMTFRAVQTLKDADLILAEDTRTSSVLLHRYDIHGKLQSHHKFNEHQTVEMIKERILAGLNVALISDAGTPGISDPGFLLVRTCAAEGIEIQALPGATACIPAIVSSGLPCDRFCFEGFLPVKKGRQTMLKELSTETRTGLSRPLNSSLSISAPAACVLSRGKYPRSMRNTGAGPWKRWRPGSRLMSRKARS